VLLQFPQAMHRTVANRRFLAGALADLESVPRAVEFRHRSWQCPETLTGLRDRDVTLVVPDVPPIGSLYSPPPAATNRTGYLRLHSRNADKWYAGPVERYDYNYTDAEMRGIIDQWAEVSEQAEKVFAFFNNCHGGKAAQNAEAFRRILEQIDVGT